MEVDLQDSVIESIKAAAEKLTGWKRREFQAGFGQFRHVGRGGQGLEAVGHPFGVL